MFINLKFKRLKVNTNFDGDTQTYFFYRMARAKVKKQTGSNKVKTLAAYWHVCAYEVAHRHRNEKAQFYI